jgi:hypothetical protein
MWLEAKTKAHFLSLTFQATNTELFAASISRTKQPLFVLSSPTKTMMLGIGKGDPND